MTTQRKRLGTALEHEVVKRATKAGLHASKQPLSGVLEDFPADAVIEGLLIEAKVRAAHLDAKGAKVLSLDMTWLDKVEKLAAKSGQRGVVVARMKGSSKLLAVLDFDLLLTLLQPLDNRSEGGV